MIVGKKYVIKEYVSRRDGNYIRRGGGGGGDILCSMGGGDALKRWEGDVSTSKPRENEEFSLAKEICRKGRSGRWGQGDEPKKKLDKRFMGEKKKKTTFVKEGGCFGGMVQRKKRAKKTGSGYVGNGILEQRGRGGL